MYIHFIFNKNEVIKISNDENCKVIYKLIDYFKANKLNNSQKQIICDIIMSLKNKTENQKIRFIMYYNLEPSQLQKYSLSSIGRYFKCSASAIRFSVVAIKNALVNLDDERCEVLKKILEQLEK